MQNNNAKLLQDTLSNSLKILKDYKSNSALVIECDFDSCLFKGNKGKEPNKELIDTPKFKFLYKGK